MDARFTPILDGRDAAVEEHTAEGRVRHAIGVLARDVPAEEWASTVAWFARTRDGNVLDGARDAVVALGGELVPETVRLGPDWPEPPRDGHVFGDRFVGATADAWVAWVARCVEAGQTEVAINGALRALGMPGSAGAVRDALVRPVARDAVERERRLAYLEALLDAHLLFARQGGVAEVEALDEAVFFAHFWVAHRPVVFRGAARAWPAWSFGALAARFPSATVQVTASRWGAWWRDRPSHHRDMPLTELLTLAQEGSGDGTYAVGHNRLFEALPALLDDVRVLPGQERIVHPSLWIGPAGTLTPLHFDPGSAWLVQRAGQKRVHLASPLEHGLLETAIDGSYNSVRPSALSDEERAARGFTTVELGPDDALWIPATWWHEVASLTPSISVRTAGFRWPDDLAHHVFV